MSNCPWFARLRGDQATAASGEGSSAGRRSVGVIAGARAQCSHAARTPDRPTFYSVRCTAVTCAPRAAIEAGTDAANVDVLLPIEIVAEPLN